MTKPKIYIYKDEGVSPLSYRAVIASLKDLSLVSFFDVLPINAQEIREGSWKKNAALLIFPGGRDIPYDRALKGKGNKHIKCFVESGGSFLGICAGAYYGCQNIKFEKDTPQEISEERELSFFPGIAYGPLFNTIPYQYEGHESALAIKIGNEEDSFHSYYHGGCSFNEVAPHDHVTVLAHYLDQPHSNCPAILECSVGKGTAILSGVHIEMKPKYLQKSPSIYSKILEDNAKRETLFESIISKLIVT